VGNKSKVLISILFILCGLACNTSVFAQPSRLATGNSSVMKVTLNKFELDNGADSTAVTAFEGTSAVLDIAAASDTNSSVGNFMSGLIVPDGNYSRVRPTPSGTFTISGSVTYLGTTYYTTPTTGSGGGSIPSITGPAQECTISVTIESTSWEVMPSTITVTDGTPNYRVRVKFNTSNSLGLYDLGDHYELFPEPPQTTMSLIPQ